MNRIRIDAMAFFEAGARREASTGDGSFGYDRPQHGVEFIFSVQLSPDRSVTMRIVEYDNTREFSELREAARQQVKEILLELGRIGEAM